ncbi:class I SAM-dependent methyltransferase [Actinomadura rugatobispora]|uniref:Class I SAM-dependent methyltransferase n=1 Tax=Actinomadura rugatobispora TaxID=1994 RepID=A0ABW1A5K0_9ACTN|nr:class I SAM-dependent methyltransferase [Actinomadura rugatobispora]
MMNKSHLAYLSSPEWAEALRTDLLPWLQEVAELGDHVLEIGPGYGLTTELLVSLAPRVTAVEIDPRLAAEVRARLGDAPVEVIEGDAGALDLAPDRFSAATCFSMLHHLESPAAQDRLFARLHGALRPGAALLGVESIDGEMIRRGHVDDTYVPVDPATLGQRLEAVGFTGTVVETVSDYQFRFIARKPGDGHGSKR